MENIKTGISNIIGYLGDVLSSIGDFMAAVGDWLIDGFLSVVNAVGSVLSAILELPAKLIDLLSELLQLLFVPEDDFFSEKITYFREKFAFVDSCIESVNVIQDAFENPTEFGSLTIDLSDNRSSLPLGSGKINVLDVSWYSEYKPYGDKIVGAFMWLIFIFNVFKQLPGIINGSSGALDNAGELNAIMSYEKGGK